MLKLLQNIQKVRLQSQKKRVGVSIQSCWRRGRVEWMKGRQGGRGGEIAGSLPCSLSMTFLVNSSYDFFPPLLFRWEEDGEIRDGLKRCYEPPFYSCQSPFLIRRKPGVADAHKHEPPADGILTPSTILLFIQLKKKLKSCRKQRKKWQIQAKIEFAHRGQWTCAEASLQLWLKYVTFLRSQDRGHLPELIWLLNRAVLQLTIP